MSRKILVRRVCGLGDLILTLPFLKALRQEHPAAELHLLAHGEHAAFLQRLGYISQGFPDEGSGWHRLYSGPEVAWDAFRPNPQLYDALYLFVPEPRRSDLVASLTEALGGRVRAIPSRLSPGMRVHASRYFLGHLPPSRLSVPEALGPGLLPGDHRLCGEAAHIRGDREEGLVPVLLHPGSGSAMKNWPAERFIETLGIMETLHRVRPWIIEGPGDGATITCLLDGLGVKTGMSVLRLTRLVDLALCLRESCLFIGNDSGVTHLSALMQVPTIALFGPSDPVQWAPLGPRARTLCREDACRRSCHLSGWKECPHKPCPRFPTVQDAVGAAREFLTSPNTPQKRTS